MGQSLSPAGRIRSAFSTPMERGRKLRELMARCLAFSWRRNSRESRSLWSATARRRRDFLFVTDVARAFFLAATTDRVNEIYNLGAGNPQTVNRLIELLGGGEIVRVPKRPGEPDCTWADITKIQRDLGWKQQVSFEEGVGADAEEH